jgi:hypothetical protein
MIATVSTILQQGREASAEELGRRLQSAPPEFIEGALDNSALSEEHVLEILRNPGTPAALLQRLGAETRWTKSYAVRAGLVNHPATPAAISMHLLHFLFWRDLARVADSFRVAPPLRRAAENLLKERVKDLALGERMALARIAGRSLICVLRHEANEMVISALLNNSRLTEEDLLLMCNTSASPRVLTLIGQSERWRSRPAVRLALVRNRRTPLSLAVSLLPGLKEDELRDLCQYGDLPHALRSSATRLLEERRRASAMEVRRP